MKRITVLVTEKNNERLQRFRSEFINATKEDISYSEALNWLLNYGSSDWFRDKRTNFRERFYKVWVDSERHRNYQKTIDEFDFLEFIQKKRGENKGNIF
jgi:hypothetical protein